VRRGQELLWDYGSQYWGKEKKRQLATIQESEEDQPIVTVYRESEDPEYIDELADDDDEYWDSN